MAAVLKKKNNWQNKQKQNSRVFTIFLEFFPSGELFFFFKEFKPGGDSAYERGGDACQKFWIKPLKETDLGVAQAFFNP